MDFKSIDDFLFVDHNSLSGLSVSNDIYPRRSNKSLIKGLDIAFLMEAIEERRRSIGLDEKTWVYDDKITVNQMNEIISSYQDLKNRFQKPYQDSITYFNGNFCVSSDLLSSYPSYTYYQKENHYYSFEDVGLGGFDFDAEQYGITLDDIDLVDDDTGLNVSLISSLYQNIKKMNVRLDLLALMPTQFVPENPYYKFVEPNWVFNDGGDYDEEQLPYISWQPLHDYISSNFQKRDNYLLFSHLAPQPFARSLWTNTIGTKCEIEHPTKNILQYIDLSSSKILACNDCWWKKDDTYGDDVLMINKVNFNDDINDPIPSDLFMTIQNEYLTTHTQWESSNETIVMMSRLCIINKLRDRTIW